MRKHLAILALPMLAISSSAAIAAEDVAKQITDIEAKWTAASTKHDAATIASFVTDDWTGIGPSGKTETKAALLARTKDTAYVTKTASNHDVHVRVIGNVAVAQGATTEVSTDHGKDSSGTYVWTDVFQNHGGKWVAVASETVKAKK